MRTERSPQVTTRDTQRLRLIRGRFAPPHEHCAACERDAQWLTAPEAAAFARVALADIDARLDAGELHTTPAPDGARRVCLNSLLGEG
ncbi:MAG TPA: hypothetical protein VFX96_12150 [Pyrinomonadaceae bacterium]|nr:hypothetical protein [Pyrinomonadaceae bacterium]